MLSRDIKRNLKKKKETSADKKKQMHPFLYAFTIGILVLVVVTFIGLPVASKIGKGNRLVFGSYEGKEIVYTPGNYFAKQRALIGEQVRQGGESGSIQVQTYKVWRGAFDRTVMNTAILLEIQKSGIWISENRVDKAIIKSGPYTINGKFSEERYNDTPNSEKFSTRKYFREQLLHDQYLSDFLGSIYSSNEEKDFFKSMADPERSFTFVTFPFTRYPDKEVKNFADKNSSLFKKIKLSRILIKTKESDAMEIKNKLNDKVSSFEELAKTYSKDSYAAKGGDMGWQYYYQVKDDFKSEKDLKKVFSMKEGEISDVIKSNFGWMIFRSNSPVIKPDFENKDTLDTARKYIMRYEKGKVEDYFMAQANKFVQTAGKTSFFDASGTLDVVPYMTNYFPLNYQKIFSYLPVKSKGGKPSLATANYSKEFFTTAYSLKKDEISRPVLLDDQVLVLQFTGEKKLTDQDKKILDRYYSYYVRTTDQSDLQAYLTDPKKLVDNFNETFYKYIAPKS